MSSEEPIYICAEGDYITDADRQTAMLLGMETGRPVIVNVKNATVPKPRWWQFWKKEEVEMTNFRIIRTLEELEALAREDAAAVVLASEAGAVRTVRALAAMYRLGSVWGLPAVVIATGAQVRAAREAMEEENG